MNKVRKSKYEVSVMKAKSGFGLRAETDIEKNKFIIEYFGKILPWEKANLVGGRYLFEINTKWAIDGTLRKNVARYINHSCRPNCEVEVVGKRVYIYSKRNIKTGEELAYNYGKEYFNEFIKPNGCLCLKCLK